jgi:hypothetical protein
VSNEKLSSFQNIYIVDSQGTRHDVIFSFDGDRTLTGNVIFNDYPIGVTTIFAQVKDEVDNISNLANFPISVITSTYNFMLRLTMAEEVRNNTMTIKGRTVIANEKQSIKAMSEKSRKVTTSEKTRETKVSDID